MALTITYNAVVVQQIATLGKKTAKRYSSSSVASVKRGSINPGSGGDEAEGAQALETWILLELCDAGSLQVCTPCVAPFQQPFFGNSLQGVLVPGLRQPIFASCIGACRGSIPPLPSISQYAALCQQMQGARSLQCLQAVVTQQLLAMQAAIDAGKLRQPAADGGATGPPDMGRVLACAREMASALHYLHDEQINHGEHVT